MIFHIFKPIIKSSSLSYSKFSITRYNNDIYKINRILRSSINHFSTSSIALNQSSKSYYQILEIPNNASIKDIKNQFKKLSKKYHPDLNNHLGEEEKKANSDKFVVIVTAYDTLKDIKKKKQYDLQLKSGLGDVYAKTSQNSSSRNDEWQNKYYGEAKYYSRSGSNSHSGSGLNAKRHRVYHHGNYDSTSAFSGKHVNYGDRFDVPHFNYNEHLLKNLKFEQRIISKRLSDDDRKAILKQLSKSGDISNLSEELITKHLMRQVHHSYNKSNNQSSFAPQSSSAGSQAKNPYMYQGPHKGNDDDNDGFLFKSFMFLGGVGSICVFYSFIH